MFGGPVLPLPPFLVERPCFGVKCSLVASKGKLFSHVDALALEPRLKPKLRHVAQHGNPFKIGFTPPLKQCLG